MAIIQYLLSVIQYLYQQNCWLINFICRYIPLKQWAFDDSHSPKYQKFKIDQLPLVTNFRQSWTYKELIPYFEKRNGKKIRPVSRRSECDIPNGCSCPHCDAPKPFLYKNNGSKGQLLCKVCPARFSPQESRFSSVAIWVKLFVDQYLYEKGTVSTADETHIKIRGVKTCVWLIMNAAIHPIIGYLSSICMNRKVDR